MWSITNYGFVIDNRRCIGCHSCTVACKAEHDDALGTNKTWVKYIEKGDYPHTSRKFSVIRCNHCNDSPCTEICPVNALFEREDGIVDFDPDRCIGCKSCMQACPYDSIHIDPETETAAKCNYCAHRVDSGRQPACVNACPEDAIIAGDMDDPESTISTVMSEHELQVRKPEKGTDPSLSYINGDEASLIPGSTARQDHYLWSDAPSRVETHGPAVDDFDLDAAAESLADSDVDLGTVTPDTGETAASDPVRSDGGYQRSGGATTAGVPEQETTSTTQSATKRAYELLHTEAERVYDIGQDHARSWGWEVYTYTWTKSIATGALIVPALLMLIGLVAPESALGIAPNQTLLGASALVGLGFLGITGGLLIGKLTKPTRFHWVMTRPNWSSWLAKGAYVISAYGAALGAIVLGWLLGVESLTHPVVLGGGASLGTATAVYTAFLLGQAKGRDLWQSPGMAAHLFVQAVLAGATLLAIAGSLGVTEVTGPARIVLAGAVVGHAAFAVPELTGAHQTEDAEEAAQRILRGRFRTAFWGGGVLVGMVLPIVMLVGTGAAIAVAAAGVFALLGLFAYEYSLIIAPQTISMA